MCFAYNFYENNCSISKSGSWEGFGDGGVCMCVAVCVLWWLGGVEVHDELVPAALVSSSFRVCLRFK